VEHGQSGQFRGGCDKQVGHRRRAMLTPIG
jgi:hypothetical protein